jgi:uncharacterized protein (DUF849 family)
MLIQACLNGSRARGEHPALPTTPDELARAAEAAVAAGAGAIHIHARGADSTQSIAPEHCAASLAAIRARCPGVPIGLSTAAWIEPDVARRLALIGAWHVLRDYVSVNFSEEGATELCALVLRRGIGVEAGLANVDDAERLAASGLAPICLRVLWELETITSAGRVGSVEVDAALAVGDEMIAYLDRRSIAAPRLLHCLEGAAWPALRRALTLGYDTRIGLEDTSLLPDGSLARDNADLVAHAVALACAADRR